MPVMPKTMEEILWAVEKSQYSDLTVAQVDCAAYEDYIVVEDANPDGIACVYLKLTEQGRRAIKEFREASRAKAVESLAEAYQKCWQHAPGALATAIEAVLAAS